MADEYCYTQIGIITILMIALAAAFTAFVFISGLESIAGPGLIVAGLVVVGLLILALASFYSFSIQIAGGRLNFWFGFGVGKRSIDIADIRSIEIVKTPWYYFWGIKSIPGGWLYSIAPGGRALELVFMDNRVIHLGTDRPEEIKARLDPMIGTSV
jgi:hypothetical protein